jgi:hypothetical protein
VPNVRINCTIIEKKIAAICIYVVKVLAVLKVLVSSLKVSDTAVKNR